MDDKLFWSEENKSEMDDEVRKLAEAIDANLQLSK